MNMPANFASLEEEELVYVDGGEVLNQVFGVADALDSLFQPGFDSMCEAAWGTLTEGGSFIDAIGSFFGTFCEMPWRAQLVTVFDMAWKTTACFTLWGLISEE